MIEKMKKLSLLIYHSSKDKFLEDLQKLGVVHLNADKSISNEEILKVKDELLELKKTNRIIELSKENHKVIKKQETFKGDIDILLDEIEKAEHKLHNLLNEKENLHKEIESILPWGIFDPESIEKLNEIGVNFKFYSCSASKFNKIDFGQTCVEIISSEKGRINFVIIYKEGEDLPELDISEIRMSLKNLDKLNKRAEKLDIEILDQQDLIFDYTKYSDFLIKEINILEDKLDYNIIDANLQVEVDGNILVITGWIPVKNLLNVEKFLKKEDVYYFIDEPKQEDNVPIKLNNGPFAKLFEPITKMNSLPSYMELDPTPFFAPFFALFFGLCLADLGYGLILFTVVLFAFIFVKGKKAKPTLWLGLVLSLFTIIGGILLNTFFGAEILKMSIFPVDIKKFVLYGNMNQAMGMSLIIGIIQVFFGFFLQAYNRLKKYGFFGIFYPISTVIIVTGLLILAMPFLANVMGIELHQLNGVLIPLGLLISLIPNITLTGTIVLGIGIILLFLFNNLEQKIFVRPALGLWELYGLITGVPGDILSYIRLFALGLAGGLLGNAFNQIAFMLRDGISFLPLAYLAMAAIMIVGHGLNLALAALSAFVHPLRLILLEFYKSVDFTGGGLEYSPFKNR